LINNLFERGLKMELTIKQFEECFNNAIKFNAFFVEICTEMRGVKESRIILNPSENFENELAWYKKAYNENLTLKALDEIKIVGFGYGSVDMLDDNM